MVEYLIHFGSQNPGLFDKSKKNDKDNNFKAIFGKKKKKGVEPSNENGCHLVCDAVKIERSWEFQILNQAVNPLIFLPTSYDKNVPKFSKNYFSNVFSALFVKQWAAAAHL